jgi:hypothetical protein
MEAAGSSESGTQLHATGLPPPDISAVTKLPSYISTSACKVATLVQGTLSVEQD